MAVTYSTTRIGNTTQVTATSSLSPAPVYLFWYLDGQFVGSGTNRTRSFYLLAGAQSRVDVLDSLNPAFDYIANAPDAYPARKTLAWVRSLDTDVESYRIDQTRGSDDPVKVGAVAAGTTWEYTFLTPRLDDLTDYTWTITPVDTNGNDGTPLTIGPERIVRTPDAPGFTATLDPDTNYLTITEKTTAAVTEGGGYIP